MLSPIVAQELALLEQTLAQIDAGRDRAAPSEEAVARELDRLQEAMVERSEAKDEAALLQQFEHQSALLKQLRASRQMPRVDRESPYFAHMRLQEGRNEWDLCLGKATFIKGDVSVVDWRNAPISRVFYRYRQGEEYEEEISGRLREGRVVTRRTVAIRSGALERVDAPEGTFRRSGAASESWEQVAVEPPRLAGGEGVAVRAYQTGEGGHRRLGSDHRGAPTRIDKHLPDIAGLIDPEQFHLITRPASGLAVVRGTAGSGKTTVALHRIAYLAYDDAAVDSERTMFVVFSRALRNYVSHVLPALGVERVRVCTFTEWAGECCKRLFPKLPATRASATPGAVFRLKTHPVLLTALAEQVRRVSGPRTSRQVVDDWGSVLTEPAVLEDLVARVAPGSFSPEELHRAANWNRERYDEVLAWGRGEREVEAELDPEDLPLLLRAWQLRVGPLPGRGDRPLRYRHIAVDEVQDFSPLEVRVLLDCLDDHQSMTLAGDTQQHVMQNTGFTSWQDFFASVGLAGTEVDTLRTSYRSSAEITSFAQAVLGPLREDDEPPLTVRSGPPVEIFRFTEHGACVAFLADALRELQRQEPVASIAVLTPSPQLSEIYYRGLQDAEVDRLRWVQDQDFTFAPGIEVTEIDQVKGLEFDYVVLVEVSRANFPESPTARRLLHVGATRAIHQLWLTSVATPSALIGEAGRGA